MTVPNRIEACRLLLSLDPPQWALRHARAVAEVAGWLAARITDAGTPVDVRVVEAAALLHDVDKLLPSTAPERALPHGDGSAAWLAARGHPELGRSVANHPVTKLRDGLHYRRWSAFASREERIVAYADKRAGQRLEPMSERFASWGRRYPDRPGWDAEVRATIEARARRLEADVCRAARIEPSEVNRLPWTARALAAAGRPSGAAVRE